MGKGFSEDYDTTPPGIHITSKGFTTKINRDKQMRHYQPEADKTGRSFLFITIEHAQELINEYADQGTWKGNNNEVVNFGEFIGYWVDINTGEEKLTMFGMIRYSKTGTHLVPAAPDGNYPKEEK
ncbi:MAG: polymorphic toxin type 50 domain-containing protein [Mobiluncus porci]|uniref:Bacterial toxin 50 domain-containing protein n=1 Tax=Mobiluncus porci TaxID=2652278 RepID=A0A7K0K4K1_9ACTO|nr:MULTISPECIES: polymorphic toxin type 50 domain-containing protein [Mobiluncus]MCI6584355.1 polymorphic toxin type 50 domain-containing protein [Mobiluncus sp.]MDD7541773.1 polymorphic toxin type 50 domain-containing protein [Mobiluncus porci]MDY5748621.1 polymorphic toxin type 50 domain-containing protein [Mobiluncus porci]MST50369.1 hypothetical protein [Mobiluncus porci]